MGISNWCGENFIGWWAADFQIYVLRFPSAKHSDEPLKAGVVFSKGFHDFWVSSLLPQMNLYAVFYALCLITIFKILLNLKRNLVLRKNPLRHLVPCLLQ